MVAFSSSSGSQPGRPTTRDSAEARLPYRGASPPVLRAALLPALLLFLPLFAPAQVASRLGRLEATASEEAARTIVFTNPDRALLVIRSEVTPVRITSNNLIHSVEQTSAGRYRAVLAPGTHRITFQVPGYEDLELRLHLKPKQAEVYQLSAKLRGIQQVERGTLVLETEPPGARVTLNNLPLEKRTPLRLPEQPAGLYTLQLRHPGEYFAVDTVIEVRPGRENVLREELVPTYGHVNVRTDPPGAVVLVDGVREAARTPARIKVPVGTRRIEARREDYYGAGDTITLAGGQERSLSLTLEPHTGRLSLTASPDEARITVQGRGTRTGSWDGILPVGSYTIEARAPGFVTARGQVRVARDRETRRRLELERYGRLEVASTPSGASVTLDGEVVGRTPLTLPGVVPGSYPLVVSLGSYQDWEGEAKIASGETERIRAELSQYILPSFAITLGIGFSLANPTGLDDLTDFERDQLESSDLLPEAGSWYVQGSGRSWSPVRGDLALLVFLSRRVALEGRAGKMWNPYADSAMKADAREEDIFLKGDQTGLQAGLRFAPWVKEQTLTREVEVKEKDSRGRTTTRKETRFAGHSAWRGYLSAGAISLTGSWRWHTLWEGDPEISPRHYYSAVGGYVGFWVNHYWKFRNESSGFFWEGGVEYRSLAADPVELEGYEPVRPDFSGLYLHVRFGLVF